MQGQPVNISRELIDLLQPGVSHHLPGGRMVYDHRSEKYVVERNGQRHELLTRAEVEDGSYKEKFRHRLLAIREDK